MRHKPRAIDYGPAHEAHGYKVRFVENVSRGLRKIGFADEILKLRHQGWYADDDSGMMAGTYRGIVYQLPARDGVPQYVYGYADPNNDDCALLSVETESDKKDAARYADQLAERFAEHERAFLCAWQAGR